jgi:hypothetical protein
MQMSHMILQDLGMLQNATNLDKVWSDSNA